MKRKLYNFFASICFEGEGAPAGGGSGDGGDAKPAASGAGGEPASLVERAAAAAAADKGAGATPYFPEGFPEDLRGASDQETIDKLLQDRANRPAAPEKPDGYTFAFSEEFTAKFGTLENDEAVGVFRGVAHELGLTDAQATGVIEKIYAGLDKAGMLDMGPDPDAELTKLMPKTGDDASRQQSAFRRINDANAWVKSLANKGLGDTGVMMLSALLQDAAGVETVEFLQRTFGGPQIRNGGQPGGGQQLTDHDRAMRALYPTMYKS